MGYYALLEIRGYNYNNKMEQKYLFVAVDAALRAGEKILSIYNDPASDFEIERKAD